jgi:hypothetical protein
MNNNKSNMNKKWPALPWATPQNGVAFAAASAALAFNAAAALAGLVACFAYSYSVRVNANFYTGVWITSLALLFTAQAVVVAYFPATVVKRRARFIAWLCYAGWLAAASIVLLVGMAAPGMASQYAWAFTWWAPLAALAAAVVTHKRSATAAAAAVGSTDQATAASSAAAAPRIDVEAVGAGSDAAAPAKPPRMWHRHCARFGAFTAWSSLFWGAFLGFFLALQVGP